MLLKRLTWIVVLFGAAALICTKLTDADLWWHVVVGRWILANKTLPQVDFWNVFAVGKTWRAYSWSNEIIYSATESTWGLWGLVVAQCELALLLALTLALVFSSAARSYSFGLMISLPVLFCLHEHFALRPQSVTWILFALLIPAAFRMARIGPERNTILGVLIVLILWANTHLSALLGILVVLGILLSDSQRERATKELLFLALAMVGATFVTPYLGGEWLSLIESARHPISYTSITEFTPGHFQQPVVLIFLLMLVLLGIVLHYRQRLLTPSQLGILAVFCVLGLGIIKFLPFAAIFVGYIIALAWGETDRRPALLGDLGTGVAEALARLSQARSLALICVFGVMVSAQAFWAIFNGSPVQESAVPQAAVDYIQQQHLPMPLLSGFNEGGYLIYRFSDEFGLPLMRVALDGRTNVNDPRVFRAFEKAFNGTPGWNELVDLVAPETILWNNALPLGAILESSGRWRRVFGGGGQTGGWSVFVRQPAVVKTDERAKLNEDTASVETPRARLTDYDFRDVELDQKQCLGPSSGTELTRGFWVLYPLGASSICPWKGLPESSLLVGNRGAQRALVWFRPEMRGPINFGNAMGMTTVVIPTTPQIAPESEREFD